MRQVSPVASALALILCAFVPNGFAAEDAAEKVTDAVDQTATAGRQSAEDAAQAVREAGAVSPESLAAAKDKDRQRKAIGSRGNSNKFGSLEGLDGDELVCRVENKTGSRLKKQACYRVADIRAYRKRLEEMGDLPGQDRRSKQTDGRTNVQF